MRPLISTVSGYLISKAEKVPFVMPTTVNLACAQSSTVELIQRYDLSSTCNRIVRYVYTIGLRVVRLREKPFTSIVKWQNKASTHGLIAPTNGGMNG